jgi:hypothetical protein
MTNEIEREYRYRSEMYWVVAGPLFLGLMAGLTVYFALTNEEPVWLGSLVEIPRPAVLVGAWIGAAIFTFLFVGATVMAVQTLTCRQRIAFTATALLIPKGFWSSADQAIPYEEIGALELHTGPGPEPNRSVIVHHGHGRFPIEERCLPSKADFDDIWRVLGDRVRRPAPK